MKIQVICEAGATEIPTKYCGKVTQIIDCGTDELTQLRVRLHEAMIDGMRTSYTPCPEHGHEELTVFPYEEPESGESLGKSA